jgi:SP family myo-inositol transporter-like MFS transporter 13
MDKSIITSSTSLFALLVSPFSSVLADRLGRKRIVLYADILFILGAVLQAVCSNVPLMVAGRCIIGAGVGAASFVVPLYIAELAPASHRGRLVTATILFITLGQMVAYVVGWAFSVYGSKETGWRWMVGLGALPAGLQASIIVFMPETPRWLVKAGKSAEARSLLQRLNRGAGGSEDAGAIISEIEVEIREEETARRLRGQQSSNLKWLGAWHDLISEGKNRRALAIACLLQGLQQLCGFVCSHAEFLHLHIHTVCCKTRLTEDAELTHVLFGHHLHPGRIQQSNLGFSDCRSHQLHIHLGGAGTC